MLDAFGCYPFFGWTWILLVKPWRYLFWEIFCGRCKVSTNHRWLCWSKPWGSNSCDRATKYCQNLSSITMAVAAGRSHMWFSNLRPTSDLMIGFEAPLHENRCESCATGAKVERLRNFLIPLSCRNTSTAMARIRIPKKGTVACDSNTAEEAVEYLRQVSLGWRWIWCVRKKKGYQRNGGFQSMGVPPNQPFVDWIFHYKPLTPGTKRQFLDFAWVLVWQ